MLIKAVASVSGHILLGFLKIEIKNFTFHSRLIFLVYLSSARAASSLAAHFVANRIWILIDRILIKDYLI